MWEQKLREEGYAVIPDFLNDEERDELTTEFLRLQVSGRFRRAGVGRGARHQLADELRRDEVCWIEPGGRLREKLDSLRRKLNESFYLGLWDFEGHYAHYPPGAYYRRHLDRFSDDSARRVSLVLYLNETWTPDDGGELTLHLAERLEKILPRPGMLVVFLSDEIPHEVLPSRRDRHSFAGWFRTRSTRSE